MRSFIAWHKARHREDVHLIDAYFDAAAFEQELASLPGKYVPLPVYELGGPEVHTLRKL